MTGFEMYEISSWMDEIFTKQLPENEKKSINSKKNNPFGFGLMLVLSVMVCGVTEKAMYTNAPSAISFSSIKTNNLSQNLSLEEDIVPDGYWTNLLQRMKGWRTIEESSIELPDPII